MVFRTAIGLLLLLISGSSSAASVNEGLQAFERGDYVTARKIWLQDSADGEPRATYYLSLLYAQGKGVKRNPHLAMEYLAAAARAGHKVAQFNLGNHYNQGKWVEENPAQAAKWWRIAADADMPRAQHNLATLYLLGRGVPKDLKQARYWYQRAAALGSKPSASALEAFVEQVHGSARSKPPAVSAEAPLKALGSSWLLRQKPEAYTLQIFASDSRAAVEQVLKAHSFKRQVAVYRYPRKGKFWYALSYGRFTNAAQARAAIAELPSTVRRAKPWPRRFADIQTLIGD